MFLLALKPVSYLGQLLSFRDSCIEQRSESGDLSAFVEQALASLSLTVGRRVAGGNLRFELAHSIAKLRQQTVSFVNLPRRCEQARNARMRPR